MPTRRLMTKNLYNARDLGGFPTKDGSVTKFGVFLRSEAPVGLPEEDISCLRRYGVTASMDFRSTGETVVRPSDLAGMFPYYHCPLFHEAAVVGGVPREKPRPPKNLDWGKQYIAMAEESREWAKKVLTIAAENTGALLYHCTTGKDRTGLMTCYLLSIAGVEKPDIVADYSVSQIFLESVYERIRAGALNLGGGAEGEKPKMDESFFRTPPEAMSTLIDYLEAHYGGVAEFLREIGVPELTMEAIRQKLTEELP